MDAVEKISNLNDKIKHIEKFLDDAKDKKKNDLFYDFCTYIIKNNVQQSLGKVTLSYFAEKLKTLDFETHKEVGIKSLEILEQKLSSFEEEIVNIRRDLSSNLEKEGENAEAANVLIKIPIEGTVQRDHLFKFKLYVKIAQLFLEDDESNKASPFITKASTHYDKVNDNHERLKYKVCFAKIADSNLDFLNAARLYHELSMKVEKEEDKLQALNSAVICAILTKAGPSRSRILSQLFKDENCSKLEIHSALEKMYLGRILRSNEVISLEKYLKEHQKAKTSEGFTVLQQAIIEHNLLSSSTLYNNVTFEELGNLLGVPKEKAEKFASKMISEGRMAGVMDQVEKVIYFEKKKSLFFIGKKNKSLCCYC